MQDTYINKMLTKRITGFDSLRFVVIICVVMFHAALTYEKEPAHWWPIVDQEKSGIFTIMLMVWDAILMPALFFVSGYFAPISFQKQGRKKFIKSKFMRIGIPWILGVTLVVPLLSYYLHSYQNSYSFLHFLRYEFFQNNYTQYHFWFLGILFTFFLIYAFASRGILSFFSAIEKRKHITPLILISIVCIGTLCAYAFSSHLPNFNSWIHPGYILIFQPSKLMNYWLIFLLGIYAWKTDWFSKKGLPTDMRIWGPICFVLMIVLVLFAQQLYSGDYLLCTAFVYTTLAISSTLFFTSFFIYAEKLFHLLHCDELARYSYGIYWVHEIVLYPLLYLGLSFRMPVGLKWALVVAITMVVSWALTRYVLQKAPLLKKVF